MKKIYFILLFTWCQVLAFSQNGGQQVFAFLNQTNTGARIAAMGGDFLTIKDNDISLALANPSLITAEMHNRMNVNIVDYFHKAGYGYVSYGRSFEKYGNFVASIQSINYGVFRGTDHTGEEDGDFYANDIAMNIGWARSLSEKISLGANLKFISSFYERYSAFGAGVDVAVTYYDPDTRFSSSLIMKNFGRSFKAYADDTDWLPFEIQWGFAKRLEHLPFTYSILINDMQRWNLRYDDDKIEFDPMTGDTIAVNQLGRFVDNLARHFVVGGEMKIHNNLSLRIGYNYKRRQELKTLSRKSLIGFAWGFEIRVKKFRLAYARSSYHLAGAPNFLSITTNLSDLFGRSVRVVE